MNYSPDAFEALQEEIEGRGGALLPELCTPQDFKATVPPYKRKGFAAEATCGCKNESMFVMPYIREGGQQGFMRACAVCDSVGAWPDYIYHVLTADPDADLPSLYDDDEDDE